MKRGIVCVLLLSGCLTSEEPYQPQEYALTWTCLSPEGCEHSGEVVRINRMERAGGGEWRFTSTLDETLAAEARVVASDLLPRGCAWLYFLSLFDPELEPAQICFGPATLEIDLSIPNQDLTTHSVWLVEGRDVNLL